MSLLRRALGAMALAVGFAVAMKLGGFAPTEPRAGGWRELRSPGFR